MKSLIKDLFSDQDITAAGATGAAVFPQRIVDENGAVQVTLNQSPGTAPVGFIVIQGRLRGTAGWATIVEIDLSSASFGSSPFSQITVNVDILPQMRAITAEDSGTYTVDTGTTATVLLME